LADDNPSTPESHCYQALFDMRKPDTDGSEALYSLQHISRLSSLSQFRPNVVGFNDRIDLGDRSFASSPVEYDVS
jgi:hypothetical protein